MAEDSKKRSQEIVALEPKVPFDQGICDAFPGMNVNESTWHALCNVVFPNATDVASINLALSYCVHHDLDPFDRVVHLVPIYDKAKGRLVHTVWPGIALYRIKAHRTKQYAGIDDAEWGPYFSEIFKDTDGNGNALPEVTVKCYEWCQMTVYRMVQGTRVAFVGPRVYWLETYATKSNWLKQPNDMWLTRANGQLEKCAEAAALRRAFPELGGTNIVEEARTLYDITPENERGGEAGAAAQRPKQRTKPKPEPVKVDVIDHEETKASEETSEQTAKASEPWTLHTRDGVDKTFATRQEWFDAMRVMVDSSPTASDAKGAMDSNVKALQRVEKECGAEEKKNIMAHARQKYSELNKAEKAQAAETRPVEPNDKDNLRDLVNHKEEVIGRYTEVDEFMVGLRNLVNTSAAPVDVINKNQFQIFKCREEKEGLVTEMYPPIEQKAVARQKELDGEAAA